jgi:hypothetical protein
MPTRNIRSVSALIAVALFASSGCAPKDRWEARLEPCTKDTCGGAPQDVSTLAMDDGRIVIANDGKALVKLKRLRASATGAVVANKTLDIQVGVFSPAGFKGGTVGTIATDADGNYDGTINDRTGQPYVLTPEFGSSWCVLVNDPGVRSELVTERKFSGASPPR